MSAKRCPWNSDGRHAWISCADGNDPYNPQERCQSCGMRREPVGDGYEYTTVSGDRIKQEARP